MSSTKGPSIKYVRKIFRKTNIANPLVRRRTCAYQGVKNVSFSENFTYVLNGWSPIQHLKLYIFACSQRPMRPKKVSMIFLGFLSWDIKKVIPVFQVFQQQGFSLIANTSETSQQLNHCTQFFRKGAGQPLSASESWESFADV